MTKISKLDDNSQVNDKVLTYVQLDEEAKAVPLGSGGLLAIETFQGSRTPGKKMCVISSEE
jgi:hypothetical protein